MTVPEDLLRSARLLLETEEFLGCPFMPAAAVNPLPEIHLASPESQIATRGALAASASERATSATRGATSGATVAPQPCASSGPNPYAGMTREQKAALMDEMDRTEVRACPACQLAQTRTQTVFGEGDVDAQLVFVGEAPGAEEDKTGRPFVGRAGELLTKMIAAMGLRREDVYICNMLKCRPPGNRAPNPQELQCCWAFLLRQLQIIQPKVIVTLGNPATQGLLQTRTGITTLRGHWQKLPELAPGLGGIDVMPTFHPSFVLRQYTPDCRAKVWSDLQEVMKKLGLTPPTKG